MGAGILTVIKPFDILGPLESTIDHFWLMCYQASYFFVPHGFKSINLTRKTTLWPLFQERTDVIVMLCNCWENSRFNFILILIFLFKLNSQTYKRIVLLLLN
jgi:hypothetical protein